MISGENYSIRLENLFSVLRRLFPESGQLDSGDVIPWDCFDRVTGTLTVPGKCFFGPEINDADLAPFAIVSHLNGSIFLEDNTRITCLAGLRRLESLSGDLVIRRTGLTHIHELNRLESIGGNLAITENADLLGVPGFTGLKEVGDGITISGNPSLEKINGFNSLKEIKCSKFEISNNPSLEYINGFVSLEKVGGTVHLDHCPQLKNINFLSNLTEADNLLVNKVNIHDPSPLQRLFLANNRFPGFIKITSCSLRSLVFMSGLKYVGSSFYLHNNLLTDLKGLESLERVNASFSLASNRVSNLRPLRKLRHVNGILSVANNSLLSLAGLESLRSLRTKKWNNSPSTLRIYGNSALQDISAISNVEATDHFFLLHLDTSQTFINMPHLETFCRRNIMQIYDFKSGADIPPYLFWNKDSTDYRRFRTTMPLETMECMVDFDTDADTLIISFTGFSGRNDWRMIEGIRSHKLILADQKGMWYHGGFADITKDLNGTLSFIEKVASAKPYKNIICFGKSSGGYMAILVGLMIKAHNVIAFSPQTCLDYRILKKWGEQNCDQIRNLKRLPERMDPLFLDLEKLFENKPNSRTNVWIYMNSDSTMERSHVMHLSDRKNIHCTSYEIYDKLLAEGHSKEDALHAESFLSFCQILDESYEFIENKAFSIAETTQKITISTNLAAFFYDHFRNRRFRVHMGDKKILVKTEAALLHPDVVVTNSESKMQFGSYIDDAFVVVEVLTEPGMAFDKGRRFHLYSRIPSLNEYVTIDALTRQVRVWRKVGRKWSENSVSFEDPVRFESLGIAVPRDMIFANM